MEHQNNPKTDFTFRSDAPALRISGAATAPEKFG
jgi:hypothetical protein